MLRRRLILGNRSSLARQIVDRHGNRVINAGGIIENRSALEDAIRQMIAASGVSTYEQFIARYPATYDPAIFGRLNGVGSGATLGRAINTLFSVNPNGDAAQGTVAAQPLCLVHSGTNYAWLPGVSGNNFTTPNATANQITGDIDIKVYVNYNNNGSAQFLVSKTQTALTNHGYDFGIENSNALYYQQSRSSSFNSCNSSVGIGASYTGWVRMTRVSSTGLVTFFTSTDGATWTQLGTTFTLFSGTLDNPSSSVVVGSYFNGGSVLRGVISRATISNSINGSAVVDFNPASYNRATSQTSWTSSTGETWTLNTANTNNALKAEVVDRTMVMGNGSSHFLRAQNLAVNAPAVTAYAAFKKYVNAIGAQMMFELGANAEAASGFYFPINAVASTDSFGAFGDVGVNSRVYNQSSLLHKLVTAGWDSALSDPETSYFVNNVQSSVNQVGGTANNTGNINQTGYNIFSRNNGASLFANAMLTTHILATNADDATQRAAMYNLIRSLNNNAF